MDSQKALAYTLELQRLRAIEAAARALGPRPPHYTNPMTGFAHCAYCSGWLGIRDKYDPEHNADCRWQAFQSALSQGQGQAGERGGSGDQAGEEVEG